MPYIAPTPGDLHVNRPLSNIMIGYMVQADTYVADKVFPTVPVAQQSNSYFAMPRDSWNRDDMKIRAPATESAGTTWEVSQDAYWAPVRAVHHDIPDQTIANADEVWNLDQQATLLVSHKAMLNRELAFNSRFMTAGVWTFNAQGGTTPTAAGTYDPTNTAANTKLYWSDPASTPIEDIRQAGSYVQMRTGFRPNTLVLTRLVWDKLQDHPDIIARLDRGQTPNGPAVANRAALAAILELDNVWVMEGIFTSAKQGNNAAQFAFIGGKSALLLYVPATPGIMIPSAGYTFSWTGYLGAGTTGARVKKFRMEHLAATRVEAEQAFDQKLTGPDLGFFFAGIIA